MMKQRNVIGDTAMADWQDTDVMTTTINAAEVTESDFQKLQEEGQDWWDTIASIDTSQPDTVDFFETYIEAAGAARCKDRLRVVERFRLWQQGFTFEELAELEGVTKRAVVSGVRQIGHVLMGTQSQPRSDERTKKELNLTEAEWQEAITEAGLIKGLKPTYSNEGDGPLSWQDDGLCAQTNPDAFVVEKGDSISEQVKICNSCQAQLACLAYALVNDLREGAIYGGMTDTKRTRFRNNVLRNKAT